MNIAIDGPAGAGKSTIAKAVAKELDILYLDTGAMYRALGYKVLSKHVDTRDMNGVVAIMEETEIGVKYIDGQQHTYLDGVDVSADIRTQQIGKAASDVSMFPPVRIKFAQLQRDIGEKQSIIMDGREIGSFVLPNAEYKFFINADPHVRALRRESELRAAGKPIPPIEETVAQIVERDKQDYEREFAPLKQVPDAILIDTTDMTADETVAAVLKHIRG